MAKKKNPFEVFINELKYLHPMHLSYLMQRIDEDIQQLKKDVPMLYEREKELEQQGKISMFAPQFYVDFGNSIIDILNKSDKASIYYQGVQREHIKSEDNV